MQKELHYGFTRTNSSTLVCLRLVVLVKGITGVNKVAKRVIIICVYSSLGFVLLFFVLADISCKLLSSFTFDKCQSH